MFFSAFYHFAIQMMWTFLWNTGRITTSWQSVWVPFNLPLAAWPTTNLREMWRLNKLTDIFLFFWGICSFFSFFLRKELLGEFKNSIKNVWLRSAGLSQTWSQMNANVPGFGMCKLITVCWHSCYNISIWWLCQCRACRSFCCPRVHSMVWL